MKKYSFPLLMIAVLVLSGCNEPNSEEALTIDDPRDVIEAVNACGTITDEQAEILAKADYFEFNHINLSGLTSITDAQVESFSTKKQLILDGITSITDAQAESLSQCNVVSTKPSIRLQINKYKNK